MGGGGDMFNVKGLASGPSAQIQIFVYYCVFGGMTTSCLDVTSVLTPKTIATCSFGGVTINNIH